jgi:hypothetical protein
VWIGPHNVACDVPIKDGCRLLVSELMGTDVGRTVSDNMLLTGSGGTSGTDTVSVIQSNGVAWSVTEVP